MKSMKYIKGLALKNLSKWKNKQWYHQRFDGSPYLIHMIAEAEIITDQEKKYGGDFDVHYCFYDDGKADWYIEMEDMRKVYSAVIKAGKDNPNISHDMIQEWMPA